MCCILRSLLQNHPYPVRKPLSLPHAPDVLPQRQHSLHILQGPTRLRLNIAAGKNTRFGIYRELAGDKYQLSTCADPCEYGPIALGARSVSIVSFIISRLSLFFSTRQKVCALPDYHNMSVFFCKEFPSYTDAADPKNHAACFALSVKNKSSTVLSGNYVSSPCKVVKTMIK